MLWVSYHLNLRLNNNKKSYTLSTEKSMGLFPPFYTALRFNCTSHVQSRFIQNDIILKATKCGGGVHLFFWASLDNRSTPPPSPNHGLTTTNASPWYFSDFASNYCYVYVHLFVPIFYVKQIWDQKPRVSKLYHFWQFDKHNYVYFVCIKFPGNYFEYDHYIIPINLYYCKDQYT